MTADTTSTAALGRVPVGSRLVSPVGIAVLPETRAPELTDD